MSDRPDPYDVLGVQKDATEQQIKAAYRTLARKYHPDTNPDGTEETQKKFVEAQAAYAVLSDPEKRAQYDRFGWGGPVRASAGANVGFDGFGGFDMDDLGSMFDAFFTGRSTQRPNPRRAQRPPPSANANAKLAIDFDLAVLGGVKRLTITRGGGDKTIEVRVPPGIREGETLRVRGAGKPKPAKPGEYGDLLLKVNISPRSGFRLGNSDDNEKPTDVYTSLDIGFATSALGGTVSLDAPGGSVELKVPPGTKSGAKLRLRGRGVAKPRTPGDLLVSLRIVPPPAEGLSDEQRRIIAELPDPNSD